jgi:hypothetical protein
VIIDRQSLKDSRGWIVISLALLLICTVWYFIYAARSANGPSGGSCPGLTFAGIGTAITLFAWALTVRKWRRSARWGKAYAWLQGHVYLSLASYPIILYHAGFHWGGPLTRVLMWAFTICYVSGILVLIVQQVVPRLLLEEVPLETIYEQIEHVSRQNLAAADELVEANALVAVTTAPDLGEDESATAGPARGGVSRDGSGELKTFYERRVRPFLWVGLGTAGRSPRAGVMAAWGRAARRIILPGDRVVAPGTQEFVEIRRRVPEGLAGVIDALEGYTQERHQFALQRRMQQMLHGWLLIHVPAAWVMVALAPLHAVMALRY